LAVLKLAYNNLGNIGANMIAEAIHIGCSSGGGSGEGGNVGESSQNDNHQQQRQPQHHHHHHPSLSVLDLGFNNIGDEGCTSLANLAVARNPALATLYLSGNAVRQSGALALADVIASGCGLISLHLTANRIGAVGVKGLMRSIAEFDVTMQMAQQDRENRIALEEEKTKRVQQLREERERRLDINNDDDDNGSQKREEEEDAILGSLELDDGDDGQDDLARLNGFKCLEELHLGGTNMESTGCLSVSNMLLTNLTLKVLCLSDNGLNDQDLSLFSQSISRNRQLPLETLQLSFNKLTCVGVETLMNAIWGSKTLREIKLDNNQIRDRGAQLAAVVLTSVHLEVLDMGFNRLTIVGIKALMKSLAENCSLLTLTLSGNVLDTNASKAVSYALAYNKTIQKLYVDHCSLSYAAQRHIAAGIVSNSKLALRVMSGFPLGAISVTLGLPGAMENWTNEQVLKFIRVMWDRTRHERENATLAVSKDSTSTMGASENSATAASVNSAQQEEPRSGPSDPATVVAAANGAFEALGDAGGALLLTEEPQRAISDTSPMVSSDAVMLEKTSSGTVRVPSLNEYPHEHFRTGSNTPTPLDTSISHASMASVDSLCTANGKSCPETPVDPEAKKRNMEWLRTHYRSLNEIIQLPYVYADLLQLHRYFYSSGEVDDEDSIHDGMPPPGPGFNLGTAPSPPPQKLSGLQRKISYRGLDSIGGGTSTTFPASSNFSHASESSSKRRTMSGDESMLQPPANKRARSGKPRIDYFPRLKAQIETCLSSSKQTKALILLRQLKFVETTMFQGINPYCDQSLQVEPNEPTARDAEIILIDML
jgi:Ran GTPase-activating protein (RanGAP) involved in mRNA processing and transport